MVDPKWDSLTDIPTNSSPSVGLVSEKFRFRNRNCNRAFTFLFILSPSITLVQSMYFFYKTSHLHHAVDSMVSTHFFRMYFVSARPHKFWLACFCFFLLPETREKNPLDSPGLKPGLPAQQASTLSITPSPLEQSITVDGVTKIFKHYSTVRPR